MLWKQKELGLRLELHCKNYIHVDSLLVSLITDKLKYKHAPFRKLNRGPFFSLWDSYGI